MTPPAPGTAQVLHLVAQAAFGLFAMTLCLPSMTQWGSTFGASQADVQLTFSGYVVAFGLGQLAWGPLSDRAGRRGVLVGGLVLVVAGSVAAALADSLWTLVAARAVQGAGTAAGAVAGRAAMQDLFAGGERTRVMAYLGMAMGLCPPLATVIGGQLHVAWGWQSNFVLCAAIAGLLLAAAWRLPSRPAAAAGGGGPTPMIRSYGRLMRERSFVLAVAVMALTVATFYAFLAGAPLVLGGMGVGPDRVGWAIGVVPLAYIVGNFATSRLAARLGERRLMASGQALTVTALLGVIALAAAGWRSPLALSLPLLLLGVGHGLLNPALLARLVGAVPALAGSAAAVAGVSQQLAGALAGWAVGWLDHRSAVPLALVMLGFTLAATLTQFVLLGPSAAATRRP